MIIDDRIYGRANITAPVLIALIKSKPLQRLKGISQYGVPDKYYIYKNYNRFEHSIGVMVLLKKLGAGEEEQIAGLLHDVSHTAFSHLVDWVLGSGKTESFQDDKHKEFMQKSEVSKILKKHGYSSRKISDYKHFGLLERNIPYLCADRIDYSIREFPKDLAKECFANMTVKNGRIVFNNKKYAKLFTQTFLRRQIEHWEGFQAVSRYKIFADALKIALDKKIIKMDDFWKDDSYILGKIKKAKNPEINRLLDILATKDLTKLPKSKTISHKKFRYVDPLFVDKGKLIRLSEVDKGFKKQIEKARRNNEKGLRTPLV